MPEVHRESDLHRILTSGESLQGMRLQGLDLAEHSAALLARHDYAGVVVLGGVLTPTVEFHLREHGAIIFPADPDAPVDPYRAALYHPDELYAGITEGGYEATPDARAYAWSQDAAIAHDAYATALRALHDEAISDALDGVLFGCSTAGVMGGHALHRGTAGYAAAADLGHGLAQAGHVVLTGGGPGAMEAANLGAFARSARQLPAVLEMLAGSPAPAGNVTEWAELGLRARRELRHARVEAKTTGRGPRSIGIPTWFYGHEPPNVFCDGIAKYFSNALREDGLISRCTAGIVVLPGAAGTVQEIFQAVTPLYYAPRDAALPPLVLVGTQYWSATVPVLPALDALGAGRDLAEVVSLVDSVDEALATIGQAS